MVNTNTEGLETKTNPVCNKHIDVAIKIGNILFNYPDKDLHMTYLEYMAWCNSNFVEMNDKDYNHIKPIYDILKENYDETKDIVNKMQLCLLNEIAARFCDTYTTVNIFNRLYKEDYNAYLEELTYAAKHPVNGKDCEPMKPYNVSNANTNGNIKPGDTIWFSENGMLNIASNDISGFLMPDELSDDILDFIATKDITKEIIKDNSTEMCIQRKRRPLTA